MFLSVFDIFKIGVGPSSSHTMGPMVAAARFLETIQEGQNLIPGSASPVRVGASLHGSLAFTGKGHATDRAVIAGLAGLVPETYDADEAEAALTEIKTSGKLPSGLEFDPDKDLIFDYDRRLPGHANGMIPFRLGCCGGSCLSRNVLLDRWRLCSDRAGTCGSRR